MLLSERSQCEKGPANMILTTWHSGKQYNKNGKKISGCQGICGAVEE